jgi:hypothetical protein
MKYNITSDRTTSEDGVTTSSNYILDDITEIIDSNLTREELIGLLTIKTYEYGRKAVRQFSRTIDLPRADAIKEFVGFDDAIDAQIRRVGETTKHYHNEGTIYEKK